jgi:hypothetical protein
MKVIIDGCEYIKVVKADESKKPREFFVGRHIDGWSASMVVPISEGNMFHNKNYWESILVVEKIPESVQVTREMIENALYNQGYASSTSAFKKMFRELGFKD